MLSYLQIDQLSKSTRNYRNCVYKRYFILKISGIQNWAWNISLKNRYIGQNFAKVQSEYVLRSYWIYYNKLTNTCYKDLN